MYPTAESQTKTNRVDAYCLLLSANSRSLLLSESSSSSTTVKPCFTNSFCSTPGAIPPFAAARASRWGLMRTDGGAVGCGAATCSNELKARKECRAP